MAKLISITRFLNKELKIRSFQDSSKNGLQVKAKKEISKIGFAVDACLSTFEKAKKEKAGLLIVHHGLFWKGLKDKTGIKKKRINFLKKNKISLYACHLPLDTHPRYGNNIQLAEILDLRNIKKFGKYHGKTIGFQGEFKKSVTISKIADILNKKIKTKSRIYQFKKNKIKTIGIVSGGGSEDLEEAFNKKLDCFLTGEMPHFSYNLAKDLKQNIILSGHYETETVGVKALMPLLKQKFDVKTIFIENKPKCLNN